MKKILKKVLAMLMILIILMQMNVTSFAAFEIGEKINLKSKGRLDCLLQYYKESISGWSYKVAYYIYSQDENGNKIPAFCVESSKDGVGESGSYNTTINICEDDGIYTILYLYNNKKYGDWGLKNDEDYYLAVQTAMHCYADKVSPKNKYRVGESTLDGYTPNTLSEIKERGTAVLNTAESLYNSAIKKEYKHQTLTVSVKENGNWKEENINGEEVYAMNYKVISNVDIDYYNISLSNLDDAKLLNSRNTELKQNEKITDTEFKIVIPKSKIQKPDTIKGNIRINSATARIPAAVYANSGISTKQDYAIYVDKIEKVNISKEITLTTKTSKVIINKIDEENGKPLQGAKFDIYTNKKDKEGNFILNDNTYILTTEESNENGEIECTINVPGNYIAKESNAPKGYKISDDIYEFEVGLGLSPGKVVVDAYNIIAKTELSIEKIGTKETESGKTIAYEFDNIENKSNVAVDDFTWKDVLPTDAVRLTEISTGTWKDEQEYSIWYKTNLNNEYRMYKEGFNTKGNYTIKIEDFKLANNEYITEYEFRFGTVEPGFKEDENPKIYCKALDNLENGHTFINNAYLTATFMDEKIEKNDKWKTVVYNKEKTVAKKLPKTGF